MSFDYEIDPDQNLIVSRANGSLTNTDVVGYLTRLVDDVAWQDGMNGLVDLQGVAQLELTSELITQASEIARHREDRFAGSKWAIVADQDAVYGIARMYELRRNAESYEVQVYREVEPALEWLGSKRTSS